MVRTPPNLAALVSAALVLTPAAASALVADPDPPTEEIEVVGRRSSATNVTADAPITIVGAGDLANSSTTNLEQALTKLPSFGFQGVNGNQNDGGYGAAFVDLHNLNFNRTLVLVDGKRFVLSGIKTDEAVDLNNIPLALIDRVEVLRDGSEPEYGADAIAGVVNIVLKTHFEGSEATAYTGISGSGDGFTRQIDATWGHNFDNASLILNVGDSHRDPIEQSSRAWSRLPIAQATVGPNGTISRLYGLDATASGHAIFANGSADAEIVGPGAARPYDPATDDYNPADTSYLQGASDRKTLNILGRYSVDDTLGASAQLLLTDRTADTLLPPQTLGQQGTAKYPDGFVIPANNPFNFLSQTLSLQRVLTEVGPQRTQTTGTTWRFVAGLDGTIGDTLDWSFDIDLGDSRTTYRTANSVNLTRVFETLGIGPGPCIASTGCVPADYFGAGSLSPQAVNFIRYTDVSNSAYQEDSAALKGSMPLARLPAGALDLTAGVEARYEHGETRLDPVTLAGDQAAPDSAPTAGGYGVREGFVDLDLPLLRDVPYARSLTAGAAFRYSDYDRFGAFPTWKTALSYAPDSAIRVRATVGAGERVPAITEAFGGISANFVAVSDPCDPASGLRSSPVVDANCRAQGLGPNFHQASALVDVASGGDPHLRPETSHNETIGVVWTPPLVPDFSLAADYYRVKIERAIDSLADTDSNYIPNQCYLTPALASPLCPLVERIQSGPNAGQINRILGLDQNVGTIKTDGIEASLAYKRTIPEVGTVGVDWDSTYLLRYLEQVIGQSRPVDYAGRFASLVNVGSYTRFKSNLAASLKRDDWSVGWTVRYIGGARLLGADPAVSPYTSAPPVTYHDIVARYEVDPLTLTLGIDNLFDKSPPLLLDGVTNTNTNTYDVVGRFAYLRVAVKL